DGAAAWADSVRELDDKVKAAIAGHPAGRIEYPPAFFTLPMPGSSDSHSVVGIPASIEDYTSGANMRDGFGGLESIFPVEHLSDAELRDVARLLGLDDVATTRFPRCGWFDSCETRISFSGPRLWLRAIRSSVFGTSTALHRAVKELREFQGQLNESALKNIKRVAELMIELDNLSILSNFWDDQFQLARKQLDHKASEHDWDFKRAAQDHEPEARALQAQVDSLSQENDDLRDCIRGLENRLTAGSLNVARTMNFLNRHGTRVDGNWPRLKALLEHAKDSKMPPSDWKTQILVNAVDDFGAQSGPYVFEDEGNPDDGDSKEDDRSGNRDNTKNKPLDLSHDSSSPQQTPKKPKASGKSRSRGTVQLRPSAYTPNNHDALDSTKRPLRTVTQVRESLEGLPVVWSKRRSDLQQVMLSGLDYQDALDLVSGDNEVHTRITSRALT
ncbi:hypothetical protein F444_11401, partial [Phytophthora nicotianae P1976]